MAIVINTAPANTVSVNNEMIFAVYEATKANDAVTYPDYTYVLDLYVSSVLIARIKSRPDPTYKRGIFDVGPILRSYAAYGMDVSAQMVDYTVGVNYQVKFGEEYGGTLYTNLLVDGSDRTCFESYKKRPFTSSAVLTASMLATNRPFLSNNHSQDHILVPLYFNSSGVTNYTHKYYNEAGTQVGIDTIVATFQAKRIKQFDLGNSGLGPARFPTAEYSIFYDPAGASTGMFRINYLCSAKYTPYTLAWLNPFGGYDSQSFGLVSMKTIELARKTFGRLNYNFNASGEMAYQSNNVYQGSTKAYAVNTKTRMKFTSHLLTDAEYLWLADLFESTDVYLYLDDQDKFTPVSISDNNYEHRTYLNSRLKPLEFSVEFSDDYNSQYL